MPRHGLQLRRVFRPSFGQRHVDLAPWSRRRCRGGGKAGFYRLRCDQGSEGEDDPAELERLRTQPPAENPAVAPLPVEESTVRKPGRPKKNQKEKAAVDASLAKRAKEQMLEAMRKSAPAQRADERAALRELVVDMVYQAVCDSEDRRREQETAVAAANVVDVDAADVAEVLDDAEDAPLVVE